MQNFIGYMIITHNIYFHLLRDLAPHRLFKIRAVSYRPVGWLRDPNESHEASRMFSISVRVVHAWCLSQFNAKQYEFVLGVG